MKNYFHSYLSFEIFYKILWVGIIILSCIAMPLYAVTSKPARYVNASHDDALQELIRLRSEGVAHFESGIAQKKALAVFKQALAVKGAGAIDYYNLGVIYKKLNKIPESKKHLHEAIRLDNKLPHPHYLLGLIYISDENNQAALATFIEASKLLPNEASIHYQLSRLYREMNKKQKGLQAIVETLRLDPYHTGAMYQLYLYHQQSGDKEKAKQIFNEFSRLKKALGQTRKEINPDESILARPLRGDLAQLKKPFAVSVTKPHFILETIAKVGKINGYTVADVNDDKVQDLVVVNDKGEVTIWLNDTKEGYKFHIKSKRVTGINDIQLGKFKRSEPYSLLLLTESGLKLLPLKDVNPKPKDTKSKHQNAKKLQLIPINLSFGLTEQLSEKIINSVTLADADHDGDTDIIAEGFSQVWINRGDATFDISYDYLPSMDMTQLKNLQQPLVGSDLRNQIAVDFVAVSNNNKRWILRDDMGGQYKLFDDRLPQHDRLYWHGRADMDNDGLIDIVNLTMEGLSIDYNEGDLRFKSRTTKAPSMELSDALIVDFNNDGYKDVLYSLKKGGVQLWINVGNRRYQQSEILASARQLEKLQTIDSNHDGLLDIAGIDKNRELVVLINQTETNGAQWISFKLDGIRSAPDGRYTQIEVFYGSYYAKYEAVGDVLHVPIGQAPHAEIVRISWPNGFVENKFSVEPQNSWYFSESERISGSCPSVYAWNGERYIYITDAFISGPMGVPITRGKYFPVDDDEYVLIPGEHLKVDEQGNYRVSIVEELREVSYLDEVRLYALDYPESYLLFPNEFLMPPVFPEFTLHLSASGNPPLKAVDHHGSDVTDLIKNMDYRYPHDFNRLDYTGFADEHGVELHLTEQQLEADKLRLFLTGWFYYFDSTSLMAADQQPNIQLVWPQLQVFSNGEWSFLKRIGIPSGKQKTVVVDLSGQLPADVEKIRIWTNVEIYWDRILLDATPSPSLTEVMMSELVTVDSRLRLHGFSELIRPVGEFPMPDRFNYHNSSFRSLWNPLDGRYTRYGEVDHLINQVDSKLAVFSAGDELAMTFSDEQLPSLKPGMKRDFLIYLNGFVKDGDKYTAYPGSVDPMPFAGLNTYPYAEKDRTATGLDETEYQQYLQDYQWREPLRFTGTNR